MIDSAVHVATCSMCGEALPTPQSDPRFAALRGEAVKLANGKRALEYRLLGACRACGGSVVRVALDDCTDADASSTR